MNVYEGMAQVMKAVGHIAKSRSQGVNYEFRSIDDVMNHLHGPLADAGLFLAPRVLDDWQVNQIPGSKDRYQTQVVFRVCVDVYAADGSMVTLGPGLAQSHDYGDKAAYQAQQNAIKYLLLEAFAIPTAEMDMDGRTADPVPADPTNRLKKLSVELAEGDVEEAKAMFKAAAVSVGVDPEGSVPAGKADEFEAALRKMRE